MYFQKTRFISGNLIYMWAGLISDLQLESIRTTLNVGYWSNDDTSIKGHINQLHWLSLRCIVKCLSHLGEIGDRGTGPEKVSVICFC